MENKEFEKYLNNIEFDDTPDYAHRDKLEKKLISSLEGKSPKKNIIKRIINNKIIRLSIAAIIAIALLIPLSYGANNLIKRLIAGPVEYDDYKGDFALDQDIRVELQVGNEDKQDIVRANKIRFFVENDELRGSLMCNVNCLPEYKWKTTINLLDENDKKIDSIEHVNENAGVEVETKESYPRCIHFSFGQWSKVSEAQKFLVYFTEVSGNSKTTPDAWIESDKLNVVHGRVTDFDGKPLPYALVAIRQAVNMDPNRGTITTFAPNVITDENGYYSYDIGGMRYRVSVSIRESFPSGMGFKTYYKRLNRILEGNNEINFELADSPNGTASIFGQAKMSDGQIMKEFAVDIEPKVDRDDYSSEYCIDYFLRKLFKSEDGKFEIENIPAGECDIIVFPTEDEESHMNEFMQRTEYLCELQDGQRLELGTGDAQSKALYGRVLFEDGTPAVSQLEGFETQIILDGKAGGTQITVAKVDEDGYFAAQLPFFGMQDMGTIIEDLESGKTFFRVILTTSLFLHHDPKGVIIPYEKLSFERDSAGIVKIKRPDIYYGKILFENSKPAVPEVIPWNGGDVWVRLKPADEVFMMEYTRLCEVDNDGYFAAYFSQEEYDELVEGRYLIEIYYPSFKNEYTSGIITNYPVELLSTDKESLEGFEIKFDEIKSPGMENLENVVESIEKFKTLSTISKTYANDNRGNYPVTIEQLEIGTEELQWYAEHLEYFSGKRNQDTELSAENVLAYDKTLLEESGATLILLKDGQIKYCWPRELEILGIKKAEVEQLPK